MPDKVIDYELLGEMIDCVKREVGLRYAVQRCLQKIYDGKAPAEVQQALFNTELYKKQERNFY